MSLETSKIKGCYASYFLNIILSQVKMVNVCSYVIHLHLQIFACTPNVSEFTLSCNEPMETLYNMFQHNYM